MEHFYDAAVRKPMFVFSTQYDYLVCADVLEHIQTPLQVLRDAQRYLNVGGRLIASTGNVAIWYYRLSLLAGRFEYGPPGSSTRPTCTCTRWPPSGG